MNIVIAGGGFGGVKSALELAKDSRNKVTLISDKSYFQYYPALYSTATGRSHLQSWVPLDEIFAGYNNIVTVLDSIVGVDPEVNVVQLASDRKIDYDICILALGTVTTFFGIEGLDRYAYGIKSVDEIKKLKQHLYEEMGKNHEFDKHYIVVGAGPTGVELSAALGSYLERLRIHYGLKKHKLHINLIEAAPRVLPRMSPSLSRKVQKRLEKLGVKVQTNKRIELENGDDIVVNGEPIKSHTVIWTSGVANHPFYKANQQYFQFAPNGRVIVDSFMMVTKGLYVIGDNAATPFTGLAQTAQHDAIFIAKNIKRLQDQRSPKPYKAVIPASAVPVGENWAVFEWRGLRMTGIAASLIRRAADFIGYSEMLRFAQALSVWRAQTIIEDDDEIPNNK